MHLGIIRVSERCRLGIWFLATRRAGRRAAGQAAPIQLLIGSVARSCWCSSISSFSRFKRDAPALSVLNTASGFLRSRSIVGQRATGNCDGSSGTPTGTEGATPAEWCAAEERRQKVEPVRSGALVRMPDFAASRPMLPSWPDDRVPLRTAGCRVASEPFKSTPSSHPSRLKKGPVMTHIRVFRRWMRGIIWISSTVHAFRACKVLLGSKPPCRSIG